VFIDGFLVLDGLEMYYGGSNPYGKAHVYTGKHDQADLEAHMATLNIPCMCSDPAQYKDEEFEDATTKQDNNHYISLCGGQVGRQTHLNENGVEGIGDGKNWGYGVIDTPTEGSPVMPCPESDPDCNVPMPIELISFTAKHTGTEVDINWNTLTETNNDYFTVQRSHNGRNFDALGEVQGAGTTIVPQYYNYVDYAPLAGVSYYRLKQTDIDGKYSYSHVVPVYSNTGEHKTFEVFKTTSNGITTLECVFADTTVVNRITIHSITGKLEFEKNVAPQFNPYIVELPLAPGVYLVSNVNRHGKTVVKVLVTH
ncbi:MAG: hypothetical protein LBM68_03175, partial [Bacteroidales bacterium]|nr:hypothetical protein [Bacteroidales bacterium]